MVEVDKPTSRKRASRKGAANSSSSTSPLDQTAASIADDAMGDAMGGGPVDDEGGGRSFMTTEAARSGDADAVVDGLTVGERNLLVLGTLIISYPERDVELPVDGATAQRVLAVFSGQQRQSRLRERITVEHADMSHMWATFEVDRALAMAWVPMLPIPAKRRMTIDPLLSERRPK